MKTTKIKNDVLNVLDNVVIEKNMVRLGCGQLDRKLYLAVNEVLESIGGKWNRKAKAHIFDQDPSESIESIILTGEISTPKDNGYFPTPKVIVDQMCDLAELYEGCRVLEPSAGRGNIVRELIDLGCKVSCCELLSDNRKYLTDNFDIVLYNESDFLKLDTLDRFDRVVMNPPFSKQQDIDHVTKAFSLLNDSGILISVMSAGIEFRENKKTKNFLEFLDNHNGEIISLEDGSFKKSGTMVRTVIVKMGS